MCSTQEEGSIFRVTGPVEAQHGQFVTSLRYTAVQEIFDRGAERIRDAADVAAELAGAIGFPLSDGAAADLAGRGQLILSEATCAAQSTDPRTNCRLIVHWRNMSQAD